MAIAFGTVQSWLRHRAAARLAACRRFNHYRKEENIVTRSSVFLLKIGDSGSPASFVTVAGLRTTSLSINGEAVVITSEDSGGWRELLSGAGVRSVSVSGAGVFTGSAAEARLKSNALTGILDDYRLAFESGATMTGKFLVTRLDYAGDFNGERSYTLSLESSGSVVST